MSRQYACTLNWDKILPLYAAGYGCKAVARLAGGSVPAIREGLIKRGVYQAGQNRKGNQCGPWVGYTSAEIDRHGALESSHDKWWRAAHRRGSMDAYYENHTEAKRKGRESATRRYARVKEAPEYKAMAFARNQLMRIARRVRLCQKSRGGIRTQGWLGCTYAGAAAHITSQLKDGWTWDNYGLIWEIDHRVQLSDGDLMSDEHMRIVCHWSNLRPMLISENRSRPRGAMSRKQRSRYE